MYHWSSSGSIPQTCLLDRQNHRDWCVTLTSRETRRTQFIPAAIRQHLQVVFWSIWSSTTLIQHISTDLCQYPTSFSNMSRQSGIHVLCISGRFFAAWHVCCLCLMPPLTPSRTHSERFLISNARQSQSQFSNIFEQPLLFPNPALAHGDSGPHSRSG